MITTLPILLIALAPAPDFDTEVMPVLTRAGCNSGACHGAAAGRGGLRLSLWGGDPAADHDALTREQKGRRVNFADAGRSLVLLKPTGELRHGGGRRLAPDGPGARRLRTWVEAGAPRSPKRKLARLTVTPAETLLSRASERVVLRAQAEYDDGTREDVTRWAVFSATDPGAVDLDASGAAQLTRSGQYVVLARFLDQIVPARLTLPAGERPIDLRDAQRHNFIDDEVLSTLGTLRLHPAPVCDDAAFLRRIRLDLTGTLPAPDEVRTFLADTRIDRRARLIERLLSSQDFVDFWTLKWANVLRIQSRSLGADGARLYHAWVREQVARQTPLDVLARALVTSLGDTRRVPAASFARVPADAREQAELVGRVFLGVRLQCANCHNHPLDRWTQDDYHGLSAVFARVERGPVVRLVARGEVIHPRSGEPAVPRLPGVRFLEGEADQRDALARWLTADNPLFARAAVNRLWKEMMGRGLVEPVDDLRATNPATLPRLLDRLAEDFTRHGFDSRSTLRLIAASAAYQRGPRAGDRFWAGAAIRPLSAEVLADAIVGVTGVPDRHGEMPEGTRAIALYDSLIPSPALEVLGRCPRTGSCEEDVARAGLARTLHLINGPLLNARITSPRGRLRRLLDEGRGPAEIIEEMYLRALGRTPDPRERERWRVTFAALKTDEDRRQGLEDFLWALLTSKEFTSNH